jgi:hypothetical protein
MPPKLYDLTTADEHQLMLSTAESCFARREPDGVMS